MVAVFPVEDVNSTPQHKKCWTCKGKNKSCMELVKCSNVASCNNYVHVTCLPLDMQRSIKTAESWYCSETCKGDANEEDGAKSISDDPKIEQLVKSNLTLLQTIEDLKSKFAAAQDENKVLVSQLQMVKFGSSTHGNIDMSIYGTAGDESMFNVSNLQSTIRRNVGQLSQTVLADVTGIASTSQSADPLFGKTFEAANASIEHAKSSYLLSLKEIRKNLGELPEFEGKGYEFLNFKTKFGSIKEIGLFTDAQMISKLEKALKGRALEHVRIWLYSPNPNPTRIMQDLEEKFYHPNLIMQEALSKITQFEHMPKKNREKLENFKRTVDAYLHVCTTVQESIHLNGRLPGEVEDKLPDDLCEEWLKIVNLPLSKGSWFEFSIFLGNSIRFMKVRLSDMPKQKDDKPTDSKTAKGVVNVAVEENVNSSQYASTLIPQGNNTRRGGNSNKRREGGRTPIDCDYDHCNKPLYLCDKFNERKYDVKLKFCGDFNICTRCLRKGHVAAYCPVRYLPKCSVSGCTNPQGHTAVMHPPECQVKMMAQLEDRSEISLFQVVPALVSDKWGNKIEVTIFIDTGSNSSLISQDLYKKLGLNGNPYKFSVEWCAGGVKQVSMACHKTELMISPMHDPQAKYVLRNIITLSNLKLPKQSQNSKEIKKYFPHLRDIEIPEFDDQRPQILLGLPHRNFTFPTKVVANPDDDESAVAEFTKLGWVVSAVSRPKNVVNAVVKSSEPKVSEDEVSLKKLHDLVQLFINLEISSGLYGDRKFFSRDDERAMEIQRATMRLVNNRYEIGLYWRRDDILLPNNFSTALKRLKSTEATLKKKNLSEWANSHHDQLLSLGFARKATQSDLNPIEPHKRINYVIGFVVINQNKVPPKPRWVVDTACEHHGVSLNSALLKGPDNLVPLTQALFHFRERKFCVVADVEKMFHQVKIRADDQHCQRYLWRNCDVSKEPDIFVFEAMLFGPTDSPSKANAIRIEHALNSAKKFPKASRAANDSMYMDDLFNSEDTRGEAVKAAEESISLFAEISWKMVDFRSNDSEVLSKLPNSHINQNVLLDLLGDDSDISICKVLGIYWNPKRDTFEFKQSAELELRLKTLNENYRPSKRELLSFIMRIYDCLGIIAHFIIRGRMILQATWREQTGWDSSISDEVFNAWKSWLLKFDEISRLKVPRHYGFSSETVNRTTLHVFSDAGKDAYAVVCYFRFELMDKSILVTQVLAKARVAPLKFLTIPKLELKGAVLAVSLARTVAEQHKRMKISKTEFWCDSEIVLKWIRGFHLTLAPFVAPRVWEIRENTLIENWRYCPTKQNPADEATKWKNIEFSDETHPWFTGPPFLREDESEWPKEDKLVKTTKVVNVTRKLTQKSLYYAGIFENVSPSSRQNWARYKMIIARCVKFAEKLKSARKGDETPLTPEISVEELELAEKAILRNIQKAVWPKEYSLLSRGRALSENHHANLRSLRLLMSPDGLIRCETKMSLEENIPFDMRCPIVLPKCHETVDMITKYHHEQNFHFGLEATVARLRGKYWIFQIRQVVKKAIKRCLPCIERRARPYNVQTGPMPSFRLTPTTKPFERVGCDVFGPFSAHVGKSKRKHDIWVVIFTCLITRAVFLRRLNSLTTDEMLLAIQDLWTRRGPVSFIMSDNGKNFVGCANFLNKEFKERLVLGYNLKWTFNPAYTPQWGGLWERLIRDIKKALKTAMTDKTVSENLFDMILLQVEDVINSRPLTHVPASPDDDYPITPNLLVKLHPGYSFISEYTLPSDENSRLLVKRARKLSSKFMARWVKEYLPIITRQPHKGNAKDSIKEGDFVIYCDPTSHPTSWPRGIVCKIYAGRDGRVRLADIRLRSGDIIERRSAYRLAKLDFDNEAFHSFSEDEEEQSGIENAFLNTLASFVSRNGRTNFVCKSYLNTLRESNKFSHVQSVEKDQTHKRQSFFVNILIEKLNKMMEIHPIPRGNAMQLLCQLKFKQFIPSLCITSNSSNTESRRMHELTTDEKFHDKINVSTVKLEGECGSIPLAEIILSLAALKLTPKWIKVHDISSPKFVVFLILESGKDAINLVKQGHLEVAEGKLKAMWPLQYQPMPLRAKQFEHSWVRWRPTESTDEWKIILTRRANVPQQMERNGGPIRAVQLIGQKWATRVDTYFSETGDVEWKDRRVEPLPADIHVTVPIHTQSEENRQVTIHGTVLTVNVNTSRKRAHLGESQTPKTVTRAKAQVGEAGTGEKKRSKRIVLPPREVALTPPEDETDLDDEFEMDRFVTYEFTEGEDDSP